MDMLNMVLFLIQKFLSESFFSCDELIESDNKRCCDFRLSKVVFMVKRFEE